MNAHCARRAVLTVTRAGVRVNGVACRVGWTVRLWTSGDNRQGVCVETTRGLERGFGPLTLATLADVQGWYRSGALTTDDRDIAERVLFGRDDA